MRPEPEIDNDTYTVTDLYVGYDPADTKVTIELDLLDIEVLRMLTGYVAVNAPEVPMRMAATIAANWFDDAFQVMGGEEASEQHSQSLDRQFDEAGISFEEAQQLFLKAEEEGN